MKPGAHPLEWLLEDLAVRPDYLRRRMFGCEAIYLRGRMVLGLAARGEPWNGVLCPTDRVHHASLRREISLLRPHPVLAKWLYVPAGTEEFEAAALQLLGLILDGDPRVGVDPPAKRRASGKGRVRE